MLEVFEDAIIDSVKLLPFLFITYLIMEYIEHKTKDKTKETIKKSGKIGPLVGIKLVIGIVAGFAIDFVIRLKNKGKVEEEKIIDLCEKEHCHCEHGILKSSLKHTINIFLFILVITLIINIAIYFIGEETIAGFMKNQPILGPVIAGLIGLIPNCASSVLITQMYLENMITASTMIAGLLVGAGVGLAVLFRTNKGIKENIKITALLYAIGVFSGIVLQLIGLQI